MQGPGYDAWCAFTTNNEQYIQLDFMRKTRVTGIVTYGRSQKQNWITRYLLRFSNNEVNWHDYMENGVVKVTVKSQTGFQLSVV